MGKLILKEQYEPGKRKHHKAKEDIVVTAFLTEKRQRLFALFLKLRALVQQKMLSTAQKR